MQCLSISMTMSSAHGAWDVCWFSLCSYDQHRSSASEKRVGIIVMIIPRARDFGEKIDGVALRNPSP